MSLFKRNKNFAPAEPIIRRKTWNKMKQQLETLKSNNKKLFEFTEAKDAEIKAIASFFRFRACPRQKQTR